MNISSFVDATQCAHSLEQLFALLSEAAETRGFSTIGYMATNYREPVNLVEDLVPLSLDYAIWTAAAAQRVDALAGLAGSDSNIKSIQIWTDGKASERVKAELGKRALGYQSFSLIKAD